MRTLNRYANTSKVEEYLYSLLYNAVSDHVFAGTLPSSIGETWNDMVLIDCDSPLVDNGAYNWGTVYIMLYARPNADGSKNVPVMSQLEEKICNVLDNQYDAHYSVERIANGADYDSAIGWHMNFVHFNITITK